jgi:hypothetical protein
MWMKLSRRAPTGAAAVASPMSGTSGSLAVPLDRQDRMATSCGS